MGNRFSSRSKKNLKTVHPRLRQVVELAITRYDFSVICGERSQEDQDYAYDNGFSRRRWPNSKHNVTPERPLSAAVDLAPYPILWQDAVRFCELSKVVKACAAELGVKIIWGGDWAKFPDLAHYELAE